jgi:15-cis-phytoene synthase
MMDTAAFCENLVREQDPDRYFATLFAPAERRPGLFALYAFNIEIAKIREAVSEPIPGEIRLSWWREMLEGASGCERDPHDHRRQPPSHRRLCAHDRGAGA